MSKSPTKLQSSYTNTENIFIELLWPKIEQLVKLGIMVDIRNGLQQEYDTERLSEQ